MHKRNKHDIVQETIELINNYNAGKERCLILMRNFNEIEPPAPVERRVGDCVREADTLRNKNSKWLEKVLNRGNRNWMDL